MDQLDPSQPVSIGVVLFDGYELLDIYGPLEIFSGMISRGQLKLTTLCPNSDLQVRATQGPLTVADQTVFDPVPALDVLVVPGGAGTRQLQKDAKFLVRFKELCEEATVVVTICTGSMLLAETGLLQGKRATSNKMIFNQVEDMFPGVLWQRKARWVVDGKFCTASGVSAGTDFAVEFVRTVFGERAAKRSCHAAEYIPATDPTNDPFTNCDFSQPVTNKEAKTLSVGVVVYHNFELLDTFGPWELFGMVNKIFKENGCAAGFDVKLIAEDEHVQSFGGPCFVPDYLLRRDAKELREMAFDYVFVPGGFGTFRELYNPIFMNTLARLCSNARKIMTVCTGALLVAAAGSFMDGKRATTNKLSYDLIENMAPNVKWQASARYVQDGDLYTSSGVSAGTDLAGYIIQQEFGRQVTEVACNRAEYVWRESATEDPFTGDIPPRTLMNTLKLRVVRLFVAALFTVGLRLGFSMKITQYFLLAM